MKFREVEKMILDDGWYFKTTKGSHNHYKHPTKTGKVTIPKHVGDLDLKNCQIYNETGWLEIAFHDKE
jgi:predicted RNA binding protein YcfA (HicA-like mRNA interferase family)